MLTTSNNLYRDLRTELTKADEICVAVGLLNYVGLKYILNSVPKTCKLNFVVGIDLPTDPKALSKLLLLKGKRVIDSRIMTEKFFHPKVYIIKFSRQVVAFVGSANCTLGGLEKNIEMSIGTKDKTLCKSLLDWFEKQLLPNSQLLTADFIEEYKPKYDHRLKRRKKEKRELEGLKKKMNSKAQANVKARAKLISTLKKIRKSKDYNENVKQRQRTVRKLRKSLDYPNFEKLDLETFFSTKQLGTIVPIRVKGKILANRRKFTNLMKHICNEDVPLKQRVDEALNGKLSIGNVGKAFISKVLVAHSPKKYYLHNQVFTEKLRPFGLELPRGLSFGEKYELTRDVLQAIINKTNINDFATFDHYIRKI